MVRLANRHGVAERRSKKWEEVTLILITKNLEEKSRETCG